MDYRQAFREVEYYLSAQIDNYTKNQTLSSDDSVRLVELKTLYQRMRDYELFLIEQK